MTTRLEQHSWSEDDLAYIETHVREAYRVMDTHAEVFTLPSGKELMLFCDGTYHVATKPEDA